MDAICELSFPSDSRLLYTLLQETFYNLLSDISEIKLTHTSLLLLYDRTLIANWLIRILKRSPVPEPVSVGVARVPP